MAMTGTLGALEPVTTERASRQPPGFDAMIEAAAKGDPAGLSGLFRAYQPMLLRYLRSHAFALADDLAGEVWLAVARNLPNFSGDEAHFRAWLFTIARCRLIEANRKRTRRRTDPVAPEAFEGDDGSRRRSPAADPATLVVEQLTSQQAVDAIVSGLTPAQAEVVVLRIVAGLDVAQVAAIMGRSPSSVRVLCHRALQRLRERFPEGGLSA
jgi:RNA polymerase sigma-70 factor (ECF subfamily)